MSKKSNTHPQWATKHKKPGTELKLINGNYYLYAVKSVYDKVQKKSKKVSLGILGSINENDGFVPSEKQSLRLKSAKTYHDQKLFILEYGYAKWLMSVLESDGIVTNLQKYASS